MNLKKLLYAFVFLSSVSHATLSGWNYKRTLTDSNATTLTNFVSSVTLTASNFTFGHCNSDGSDIRVYDETTGTILPYWLFNFNPTSSQGVVYYKVANTTDTLSIYYGNSSTTSIANFANVFTNGTGFDSGFGDLTTNVSADASAIQYSSPTSLSDSRNYQFWTHNSTPVLTIQDLTNEGIDNLTGGYTGVREINLLRDNQNRVMSVGGKYYVTFARRPNVGTSKIDTWIGTSTVKTGPFSGFKNIYTSLGTTRLGYPGTMLQEGGTYYLYLSIGWNTSGGTTPNLTVYMSSSTDLVTFSSPTVCFNINILNDNGTPCNEGGNPWVIKSTDGIFAMTIEAQDGTTNTWKCYGLKCPNLQANQWTALNSSNPLVSPSASPTAWDGSAGYGAANPKIMQLPDSSWLIEYNGSSDGSRTDGDWNLGFATAATRDGPYSKLASNPIAGKKPATYGIETAHFSFDENGTDLFQFDQRFSTSSATASAYKLNQINYQGGLLVSRSTGSTDGAIMGKVLANGSFTAESRSVYSAQRNFSVSYLLLALYDSASVPSPAASSTFLRNVELEQDGWDTGVSTGGIRFVYTDSGGTRHHWNGTAWGTVSLSIPADIGREVVAKLQDDTTNYIYTAAYADNGTVIASTSIAKSAVRTFASGRCLISGDPFTDAWTGGQYYRYVQVKPYAATEPSMNAGGEQDLRIPINIYNAKIYNAIFR